jgi:hypothetical protein
MMYEMSRIDNLQKCFVQDHLMYVLPDDDFSMDQNM